MFAFNCHSFLSPISYHCVSEVHVCMLVLVLFPYIHLRARITVRAPDGIIFLHSHSESLGLNNKEEPGLSLEILISCIDGECTCG